MKLLRNTYASVARHLVEALEAGTISLPESKAADAPRTAAPRVRVERWQRVGADWVQRQVENVTVELASFIGATGLAHLEAGDAPIPAAALAGGRAIIGGLQGTEVEPEPMRLELRLFVARADYLRLQASLHEGDQPARRAGQRLIVQTDGKEPEFHLRLGYGGSFEPEPGSPDPYHDGLTAGLYRLTLQVTARETAHEFRFDPIDLGELARTLAQPEDGE
jgi:hypothetical protein